MLMTRNDHDGGTTLPTHMGVSQSALNPNPPQPFNGTFKAQLNPHSVSPPGACGSSSAPWPFTPPLHPLSYLIVDNSAANQAGPVAIARGVPELGIASKVQVTDDMGLYSEQVTGYLPTPDSAVVAQAAPNPPAFGGDFAAELMGSGQLATYINPDFQVDTTRNQQAPLMADPSMYQPQLNQDAFISPPSESQNIQDGQPPPFDYTFAFQEPAPHPPSMVNYSVADEATLSQQAGPVPLNRTHSTPTHPRIAGPTRLARSKSILRTQLYDFKQARRGSLKRESSTTSTGSSSERSAAKRSGSKRFVEAHPSIPQGEWQQSLKELQLGADGKYYTLSPKNQAKQRGALSSAGYIVRGYACQYRSPTHDTECWRRVRWGQPSEWLIAVSNGARTKGKMGFFPRHPAEMLRHLAIHRIEEVSNIRGMPVYAGSATLWQDQLIDEQIIKDRDNPDNQVWYPDEIRKSREELDHQLTASPFYHK